MSSLASRLAAVKPSASGHVASVPGSPYGLSPHFRIPTAASDAVLTDAMTRIAAAVAALSGPVADRLLA